MITVAVEDQVSKAVAIKVVKQVYGEGKDIRIILGNGYGGLKKRMPAFRNIAKKYPVWLLTDLDRIVCPTALIANWTGGVTLPKGLSFRVAVKEVESWLLADREAIAEFLGVSSAKISRDPESIDDPKEYLINIARIGNKRDIRSELVPKKGTTASQGFGYNPTLCKFVADKWSPQRASNASRSLAKAIERLSELKKTS